MQAFLFILIYIIFIIYLNEKENAKGKNYSVLLKWEGESPWGCLRSGTWKYIHIRTQIRPRIRDSRFDDGDRVNGLRITIKHMRSLSIKGKLHCVAGWCPRSGKGWQRRRPRSVINGKSEKKMSSCDIYHSRHSIKEHKLVLIFFIYLSSISKLILIYRNN